MNTRKAREAFAIRTGLGPIPPSFSYAEARETFYAELADLIDHLDDLLPPLAETPEDLDLELAVEEAAGAADL